jgi:hypothetical protein
VTVQLRAHVTETAIHPPTETPMLPLDLLTFKAGRVVVVDRRGLQFRGVEHKARRHAPLLSLSDPEPSVTADSANSETSSATRALNRVAALF